MDGNITRDTLRLLNETMSNGKPGDMIKAWLQPSGNTTGIQNYDLEKPALSLVPVETPLVNEIPVVGANGGIQANWHAITGINTTRVAPGLSEGNRNANITSTSADYFAKYAQFGLDDFVTEEAEWAAEDYIDLLARGQGNLLWATKIAMESVYLGGLGTYGLGQATPPTLSAATTGGTLVTQTLSVRVAALTLDGLARATVAGGVAGTISRTNMDGSTDSFGGGTGQLSTNTTVAITGPTGSAGASAPVVTGAVGYAWFWGAAGSELLGAITTTNSVLITAPATGSQTAASVSGTDFSQNNLVCDGLLSLAAKAGMNGYTVAQATGAAGTGTPLTADGEGGIVEIDTDLKFFYDNLRLTPTNIWVSSQELINIGKKIGQGPGSGTSNLRFMRDAKDGQLIGAVIARAYLNKFTVGITGGADAGQEIPIRLHPNLPAGTIIYDTRRLPYPLSNVSNVVQFRARKNFYATLWPKTKRRWEFGVYLSGVLQHQFIPSLGVRSNIANG
jgi:hypothetical protein